MGYKSETIKRVVLQTPTKDECVGSKCCGEVLWSRV